MYIGVDDTDSRKGMCTTYLATEIIREFSDFDLIGYPRLVRLNPNVPWKTRGNGAVTLRFGKGVGRTFKIGEIDGNDILACPDGEGAEPTKELLERLRTLVEKNAHLSRANTNPGFVMLDERPPEEAYWKAVRQIVEKDEVLELLEGKLYGEFKNGRGLIGATSANAWAPGDKTYELIAYRKIDKWGTLREIDENSVIEMDKAFPTTFNNYDYENKHIAILPSSPCPVFFGIRGDAPEDLPKASGMINGEEKARWLIFETNQGTDDHLVECDIRNIEPYRSVITKGVVKEAPRTIEGGHVIFSIESEGCTIDCAAYEPSKQFRNVVRELLPGDEAVVYGGVREVPFTINVEKLEIVSLIENSQKVGNPICPQCGKRMKSIGRDAGYRCNDCGTKASEKDADIRNLQRKIVAGIYEPPVGSRRHLSKPLKRY